MVWHRPIESTPDIGAFVNEVTARLLTMAVAGCFASPVTAVVSHYSMMRRRVYWPQNCGCAGIKSWSGGVPGGSVNVI
jgi:hypothetical protein